MKLSIIIPIYNVEDYIEKCLYSCINQDVYIGTDYEIICVNDGTKDKSAHIAKNIAANYQGIFVVDQNNGGLSVARNTGLSFAKGDYVWFVDSDDYLEENCLRRIFQLLGRGVDILNLSYREVYVNGAPSVDVICSNIFMQTGRQVLVSGHYPTAAQFSIYKREFLQNNNLYFMTGIYHEDIEFKPKAICLAGTVSSDMIPCYNYLQRTSGSITASYNIKRVKDSMIVNRSLFDFCQHFDLEVKIAFFRRIGMTFNNVFWGYHSLNKKEKEEAVRILNENKDLLLCMRESGNLKYMIEAILMLHNIQLGLFLYKLLK